MMRIAIVNDLALAVESLRRAVATIPGASVAWIAQNGVEAVDRCARDVPDLVLMDMIMPVMDGVEATRRIMRATPCPILVVTASVEGNAGRVFEALGAGALDAVATPGLTLDGGVVNAEPLVRKVRAIAMIRHAESGAGAPGSAESWSASPGPDRGASGVEPLLAIGASTGGPEALVTLLRSVASPAPWPVVIVQHIDQQFASGLCEWLSGESGHRVLPASDDATPRPGTVLLASSNDHIILTRSGRLRYTAEPRDVVYRPSVDVFFSSLLGAGAKPGAAALLTGMGRDGAAGLGALRGAGWYTVAQDEATSVVWGMPGAAARADAAVEVLPIRSIGRAVSERLAEMTGGRKTP